MLEKGFRRLGGKLSTINSKQSNFGYPRLRKSGYEQRLGSLGYRIPLDDSPRPGNNLRLDGNEHVLSDQTGGENLRRNQKSSYITKEVEISWSKHPR
jgi:hypothetical protein